MKNIGGVAASHFAALFQDSKNKICKLKASLGYSSQMLFSAHLLEFNGESTIMNQF